ncbi:MAG: DUF4160 domain-containing protein [Acidobacteriota bacterium]
MSVIITSGEVEGSFPQRALALVQEWREMHAEELLQDWRLARAGQPLHAILGLE